MGEFTDFSANEMVDWLTGKAAPVAIGTRYLALFNGDPQGAGTEVTATIRPAGRLAITASMAVAASAGAANTSVIDFGAAAAGATITHYAIFDAASGGNLLGSDALTGGSQTVSAGNPVAFAAGALVVSIA